MRFSNIFLLAVCFCCASTQWCDCVSSMEMDRSTSDTTSSLCRLSIDRRSKWRPSNWPSRWEHSQICWFSVGLWSRSTKGRRLCRCTRARRRGRSAKRISPPSWSWCWEWSRWTCHVCFCRSTGRTQRRSRTVRVPQKMKARGHGIAWKQSQQRTLVSEQWSPYRGTAALFSF